MAHAVDVHIGLWILNRLVCDSGAVRPLRVVLQPTPRHPRAESHISSESLAVPRPVRTHGMARPRLFCRTDSQSDGPLDQHTHTMANVFNISKTNRAENPINTMVF
jgi:hypothetical protein